MDTVSPSVVAFKCECVIAPGLFEVIVEDAATNPEIGPDVEQVVLGPSDLVEPERHDLHEPLGADRRDCKAVKTALDIDDGEHEFGRDMRLPGCFVDRNEQAQAAGGVSHEGFEPSRHDGEPDPGHVAVPETMILPGKGLSKIGLEGRIVPGRRSGVRGQGEPEEEDGQKAG